MYIKKRAAKKKEVTEGDQSLSDDWGWHFVILSLARAGPPLIPCINTSFVFCHHRLHCTNDVMTRPRGIPAAAQSTVAARSTARPDPAGASLLPRSWVFPESRRGGGRPSMRAGPGACHLQLLMPLFKWETYFFCSKIKYFLGGGPAKAKFLFPKQQITIFT